LHFLRRLLPAFIAVVLLAVVLAAVLFSPITQAWALEYWLARAPGATASVGSVYAGVHEVEVRDLTLRRPGFALTLPAADLTVSWLPALLGGPLRISRINARGWTLEVGDEPPPATPGTARPGAAAAAPAPRTIRPLRLTGWPFPAEAAAALVDLEGVVLHHPNDGGPSRRINLALRGGPAASDAATSYEIDARIPVATDWIQAATLRAVGRISVGTDAGRAVNQLGFTGAVLAGDTRLPADPEVEGRTTAAADGSEYHELALRRAGRPVATLSSRPDPATPGAGGAWQLDLQAEDLAALRTPWSAFLSGVQGRGTWLPGGPESPGTLSGRLTATTAGRAITKLTWGPAEAATITADLTVQPRDGLLEIQRLDAAVGTARAVLRVQSLQPFRLPPEADRVELREPAAPWLHLVLDELPLAWLPATSDGPGLAGGVISGPLTASLPDRRLALRADTPLQAKAAELRWNGQPVGPARDLSLALRAERGPGGWAWHADPLTLARGDGPGSTVHLDLTPLFSSGRRWSLVGRGEGPVEAFLPAAAPRAAELLRGTTVSGTFNVQTGTATDAEVKVALTQAATGRSLTAHLQTQVDARGRVSWQGPATFALADARTELSLQGSWDRARTGRVLELDFGGAKVDLAAVTTDLPAWLGAFGPAPEDRTSCWGDLSGRLSFSCHELLASGRIWNDVSATLLASPAELQLEAARGRLVPPKVEPTTSRTRRPPVQRTEPPSTAFSATGRVRFATGTGDATPYQWDATLEADVLELKPADEGAATAAPWSVEGRFAAAAKASGAGRTVDDLVQPRTLEVRLHGSNGLFRFLKTNVGAALAQPKETAVSDALATAGMAVGAVLGLDRDSVYSGVRKIPKATEAILTFSSLVGERRYDDLTLVARREGTGPFSLTDIQLTAPQLRLRGTGRSSWEDGRPPRDQPVELELSLGVQGTLADLLRTGGLLTGPADEGGHAWLPQPIHFGGTLGAIDNQAWTAVLAEAATRANAAAPPAKR
jgi:hypothetical protein